MAAKRSTTVGVLFGGRSVEHDVSIVTGHQVMRAFDSALYETVPLYIDRDGRWFTGEPLLDLKAFEKDIRTLDGVEEVILSPNTNHHGIILNPLPTGMFAKPQVKRLDVIFPALHGTHGEDGTVQGLCELADIPYVGCGVLASAVANDKVMTKVVLKQHSIPVLDAVSFSRAEWMQAPDNVIQHITSVLKYPVFVKPATLGSSIGIARAADEAMLRAAIDVATSFDRRVLVEQGVTAAVEINCAVMGNDNDIRASILEQPVSWEEFLTFEQKYLHGNEGMKSAERIIPAPIPAQTAAQIQEIAVRAFQALDGRGTARIDFLLRGDEVYLNELNTMPGSLAFYLWQEMGMPARDVVHRLVRLAQDAHAEKRKNTYNYQTSLVGLTAQRGLKGSKGSKR
ncbi:MAG: D-alanine--D-alanine ligase family protein [Chloroflexota bacterium]|nr:D-alanine--D-alanine ligase family protein [Chloroflexota bacterium]